MGRRIARRTDGALAIRARPRHDGHVSAAEIDSYLAALDDARLARLSELRAELVALLPGAEQGISYGAPAFRLNGKLVAGFSASASHLSYFPHSGSVLGTLDPALLEGRQWSKGALRFTVDAPLDKSLVATLVSARIAEIADA